MGNDREQKVRLGQFFTTKEIWLRPQVVDFIKSVGAKTVLDPFAGDGHLLEVAKQFGIGDVQGFDVDPSCGWEVNDSLKSIPHFDHAVIITNPPYLTNYSASRKKIFHEVEQYFTSTNFVDLYQIALERCLESNDYVVAIVPETFINSIFPKGRLNSVTILEENPFEDTECPVCVVCFDKEYKNTSEIKVYKNDQYLGSWAELNRYRVKPQRGAKIVFNAPHGRIALRAVDSQSPTEKIKFMPAEELRYDLAGIKVSSRLITLIDMPGVKDEELQRIINESNKILDSYRLATRDITLSPFKGNNKEGDRRRRLDYKTARAILETAYIPSMDLKVLYE